jgi:elongation factor P
MISLAQIKKGQTILHNSEPYLVLEAGHHKMGRGGAVVKTKLKQLKGSSIIEHTFQGNDKAELADLGFKRVQFLYSDEFGAFFMDDTYEQLSLPIDLAKDSLPFLKEGLDVDVAMWEGNAVSIKLPPKVELVVKEAPPAVKGDTANNPSKTIILETDLKVQAPMFVETGEVVRVNTETGEYVERVS